MDRKYPLAGEAFFREMMRSEEERKQRLATNRGWGGASDSSNVVSFQDYRRRQTERERLRGFVPPKTSA
jgi:hypothetical protein